MPSLWPLEPPNPIPPSLVEVAIVTVTVWGGGGGEVTSVQQEQKKLSGRGSGGGGGDSCGIIGVFPRVEYLKL